MTTYNRHGNRWSVNELLQLQREYELLEWSVQDIAEKHERTVRSILFKLHLENFIDSWNNARGFDMQAYEDSFNDIETSNNDNSDSEDEEEEEEEKDEKDEEEEEEYLQLYEDDEDEESEYWEVEDKEAIEKLTDRIWSLETSVQEIGAIVKHIFGSFIKKPRQNVESENK